MGMTNKELIEMLRENVGVSQAACTAANLAADRIEALVADVAGWISNAQAASGWASEAEYKLEVAEEIGRAFEEDAGQLRDKLAKAVEALKYTDDGANHGVMTPTYSETGLRYILRNIRDHARVALEEIKGET
jgi:hypothetical protein